MSVTNDTPECTYLPSGHHTIIQLYYAATGDVSGGIINFQIFWHTGYLDPSLNHYLLSALYTTSDLTVAGNRPFLQINENFTLTPNGLLLANTFVIPIETVLVNMTPDVLATPYRTSQFRPPIPIGKPTSAGANSVVNLLWYDNVNTKTYQAVVTLLALP